MELATFEVLQKIAKESKKKRDVKYEKRKEIIKAGYMSENIKRLKHRKLELQKKLNKQKQLCEKIEQNIFPDDLDEEEKNILLEIETKRLTDIIKAYRLTGTTVDIVDDNSLRIRFDTCYEDTYYESFYIDLKLTDDEYTVLRHTIPSFIPLSAVEKRLSCGLKEMVDFIHTYLRAYIQRRQEALKVQELYSDYLSGEICSTPSFDFIEILIGLNGGDCRIKLIYGNLQLAFPTQVAMEIKGTAWTEESGHLQVMRKRFQSIPLSKAFSDFIN